MSQTAPIFETLKRSLRQRGLTYADVATALDLSESSVKRLFASRDLTLERLERVCALMQLEVTDLLELVRDVESHITELTEAQERELVDTPKLLLVGVLVLSYWAAEDILATFRFSEAELVKLLLRLDRVGVIELLPGNRIKLKLARSFAWRKDGPIQRFFEARMQQQFFHSSFSHEGELRLVMFGGLSRRSNELIQQRLRRVAEEFDALVQEDRRLDRRMRTGNSLVLAVRPWEPVLFTELRRPVQDETPYERMHARDDARRRHAGK
jgi:DNA-binding Xre family transcriptional regulator